MSERFETSLLVEAPPEHVFDHFTKPDLLVSWMGDFARLNPQPGGLFSLDINGVLIRGSYVVDDRPHHLVVAWGEAGNPAMPPGSTRLEVRFVPEGDGTRVTLVHTGLVQAEASKHAMGWPHFLERLQIRSGGDDPGPDPWAATG